MEEVKLGMTYTNNMYDIHQYQGILLTLIIQFSKPPLKVYFMIKEKKKTEGNSINGESKWFQIFCALSTQHA